MLWLLITLDCATLRPFLVETIAPALHARRNGNNRAPASRGWQAPKRHIQHLQEPYTNSLTPSSLSICGLRHPTQGYVQLQWYVPIAAPWACVPIYVMSLRTSQASSAHQEDIYPFHPTSNSVQDSPRTASTCGHVSFLPSTSHVFRLRHNRTDNNVADLRLSRPSPSGAAQHATSSASSSETNTRDLPGS